MIAARYDPTVSLNFELEDLEILYHALSALLMSGDRRIGTIIKLIGMTEFARNSLQELIDDTVREKGEI